MSQTTILIGQILWYWHRRLKHMHLSHEKEQIANYSFKIYISINAYFLHILITIFAFRYHGIWLKMGTEFWSWDFLKKFIEKDLLSSQIVNLEISLMYSLLKIQLCLITWISYFFGFFCNLGRAKKKWS